MAAKATHTLTKGWSSSDYKVYIKINFLCKQSVRVTEKCVYCHSNGSQQDIMLKTCNLKYLVLWVTVNPAIF